MIVVDASFIVEVLSVDSTRLGLRDRLFAAPSPLFAPHLLDVEVASVIRRLALQRTIDAERGFDALEDLAALPVTRCTHAPLLLRGFEMRDRVTAYDALYVALAEALEGTLWTCDSRLARSVEDRIAVEVF
jgi:predicted nucleic acid-binding protein